MGQIREDEAPAVPTFYDASGDAHEVACVVDTGFTGYLALSRSVVQRLGLSQADEEEVSLADGITTVLALYQVTADWLDDTRTLVAYAVGGQSLIGMKLLRGCLVTLDIDSDNTVVIEEAE